MFEKPVTPANSSSEDLLDARKKFEAEKLTRRSALKKFGITTGMSVFGMFAADDLARLVIKKMEQHEETRQIAETVAYEFKNAGVAFADSSIASDPCSGSTQQDCSSCNANRQSTCIAKAATASETAACNAAATNGLQACNAAGGPNWTAFGNDWQDCGPILSRR